MSASIGVLFLIAVLLATTFVCILVATTKRKAKEEARRRAEAEASRTAEEDRRQRIEETLRRVDETLRKADAERKAEEERQRLEALRREAEEADRAAREEALRKSIEPEQGETRPAVNRPEPLVRGGRRRSSSVAHVNRTGKEDSQRRPKPEIVCWKREREWILGVEIPDEFPGDSSLQVLQNAYPLSQDESNEALWLLLTISGNVVVQWHEDQDQCEARYSLEDAFLVFKLNTQIQNRGRRVRSPSCGTYLVIAPSDWERDEDLSGPPQWAPESVALPGYRAHYYSLLREGTRRIAFRTALGQRIVVDSGVPRFEFVGDQLEDANEDAAPLFGRSPPRITVSDERGWTDVGTVVIGEEGNVPRKWRMQFHPSLDLPDQEMPSQVAARRGGWYFLRFYDSGGDLIESLDFRFLSVLGKIQVLQQTPLPAVGGHGPATAEVDCEPTMLIQPRDNPASRIEVERKNGKVMLRIPPDPTCDETHWQMGIDGGPHVEVAILAERLWWRVCDEKSEPTKWEDKLLVLSGSDFRATSNAALWIRLPRRRWVDKISVGFLQSKAKSYSVRVGERAIAIPFRDFSDSEEVCEGTQEATFWIWVKDFEGVPVGRLAIEPRAKGTAAPVGPSTRHGRYKTAVAKVRLQEGTGNIWVNRESLEDYFKGTPYKGLHFLHRLLDMNEVREVLARIDTLVVVNGSKAASVRQARAVSHALARALMSHDNAMGPFLRRAGFGGVTVSRLIRVQKED